MELRSCTSGNNPPGVLTTGEHPVFAKVPVEKEIAATQTMSACADCLKTLALRVRVCIALDFDAVGNLNFGMHPT